MSRKASLDPKTRSCPVAWGIRTCARIHEVTDCAQKPSLVPSKTLFTLTRDAVPSTDACLRPSCPSSASFPLLSDFRAFDKAMPLIPHVLFSNRRLFTAINWYMNIVNSCKVEWWENAETIRSRVLLLTTSPASYRSLSVCYSGTFPIHFSFVLRRERILQPRKPLVHLL